MLPDTTPVIADLNNKTIKIYPVFDVHIGAAEYMKKEFEAFVSYIAKTPEAYIVIGGDILNNAIKTSVSDIYSEKMMPGEAKEYAVKLLTPIADKILCGVGGNHEWRTGKDTDVDILYDIFCQLGISERYRANVAILSVGINYYTSRRTGFRKTFLVTHGSGGGATLGAGINRQERFIRGFDGIDVFISGHTHKPSVVPISKVRYINTTRKIREETIWLVTARSWLGFGGYGVRKLYTPVAHCGVEITMSQVHKTNDVCNGNITIKLTEGG